MCEEVEVLDQGVAGKQRQNLNLVGLTSTPLLISGHFAIQYMKAKKIIYCSGHIWIRLLTHFDRDPLPRRANLPPTDFTKNFYPLYTALVTGFTRERFVALGLPS